MDDHRKLEPEHREDDAHKAPQSSARHTKLAAWVVRDGDNEVVPGAILTFPNGKQVMRPMMGDLQAMKELREHAQEVANRFHKKVRLLQSVTVEEIEALEPQQIEVVKALSPKELPRLPK